VEGRREVQRCGREAGLAGAGPVSQILNPDYIGAVWRKQTDRGAHCMGPAWWDGSALVRSTRRDAPPWRRSGPASCSQASRRTAPLHAAL